VNEIRERELEWKKLADLFAEYKEKMTEEVEGLRKIIREYKSSKMDVQEVLVKVNNQSQKKDISEQYVLLLVFVWDLGLISCLI
jgi:hypothetical protein